MIFCPNCFSDVENINEKCPNCGYSHKDVDKERALAVGTIINDKYLIGRTLGAGGFGVTYLAYDIDTQNKYAIKEYFPKKWAKRDSNNAVIPMNDDCESAYEHGKDIFIDEANTLASLLGMPSIVNVIDLFSENDSAYMVMEYFDGYTLSSYLKETGRTTYSVDEANNIIKKAGLALNELHKHKLLHRDIGPDNIMINSDFDVMLIDFGATRAYGMNSSKTVDVTVKPGYAPIEQYSKSGSRGPWTDVYALAATYYKIVGGIKPTPAPERESGIVIEPLHNLNPAVSVQISKAVGNAMTVDPSLRTQNIITFLIEMGVVEQEYKSNEATAFYTDNLYSNTQMRIPKLTMYIDNTFQRFLFTNNEYISIGRNAQNNNVVIPNPQVSGVHAIVKYDGIADRFTLTNYSGNKTFSCHGTLEKNMSVYLYNRDWFYIGTNQLRYVFYVEVE